MSLAPHGAAILTRRHRAGHSQGGTGLSTHTGADAQREPIPARRALLTGGAVGLAAIAGATLGRSQPASAQTDLQQVNQILPSKDKTGQTDTNAINGALQTYGFAWLAEGQFYIKEQVSGQPAITVPYEAALWGTGASTVLNYSGTTTCIYFHDITKSDGSHDMLNPTGVIRDLVVDGTGATGTPTNDVIIGIDCGDGWGGRIDHVYVDNFANTSGSLGLPPTGTVTGSIGWYINNQYYFTEKWRFTSCHARGNANNVVMDSTVGTSDVSHGYNYFDFHFHTVAGQYGLTVKSGVNVYHSQVFLRGNNDASAAQSSAVINLIGSDSTKTYYSQIVQSHINWAFETNGGSTGPVSINFGDPGPGTNQIANCYGLISMSGAYQTANAATGSFSFGGVLQVSNDTTLSSTNAAPKGWAQAAGPQSFDPGNPPGTTSTTPVMMGLAKTYTPQSSGNVLVVITGDAATATAAGAYTIGPRYAIDTGTPPGNQDPVTGSRINQYADSVLTTPAAGGYTAFAFNGTLSLTPGTEYWFDLALATSSGSGEATIHNISISIAELN
jgi:hypothetical protein